MSEFSNAFDMAKRPKMVNNNSFMVKEFRFQTDQQSYKNYWNLLIPGMCVIVMWVKWRKVVKDK